MAERRDQRDDEQLARALRALGSGVAYPPTPDLAATVRARLVAGRAAPRAGGRGWLAAPALRRAALAAAVVVVVVAATLAFSSRAREAVAGRLGLPGITIIYVAPTPTAAPGGTARPTSAATPTTTPPATPVSVGERLGLGQRATLAEARGQVPFPVLVPDLPALGAPDEVYVGPLPGGGQVSFVWLPRAALPPVAGAEVGLLITQFRGDIAINFGKKVVFPENSVRYQPVNGGDGYWIAGAPHTFLFTTDTGTYNDRTRLAGNVLLWASGGVTYRIEGARTLEEALRIAAALR